MRISIAMCTYNGETYLKQQFDSIAAQTVAPDELVVCDDVSSDGTVRLLKEFALAAPFPVQVIENSVNLGYTQNFNQAVQRCSGEMIALADQDDVWFPSKLAVLRQRLSDPTVGGVFSNGHLIDAASRQLGRMLWESFFFNADDLRQWNAGGAVDVLLRRNVVTGMTMAIRSSMKPLLASVPSKWIHDWWLALQIASQSRLVAEPEPLVGYRIHGRQQVGSTMSREQKLQWIRENGVGAFLQAARDRNLDEYQRTEAQFIQLAEFLREDAVPLQADLLPRVEAKVEYARRGIAVLQAPRTARLKLLSGSIESYRRYSPTGLRGLLRDLAI